MSNSISINKKRSVVVDEATAIIKRMQRHIQLTGCTHCKSILNDENNIGAGNQPAPPNEDGTTHRPTGPLESECYSE
jgi:hypothetical protein